MSINSSDLVLGAKKLNLSLNDHQLAQLTLYVDRLLQWGKALNLTAIKDPRKVLTHHLLDSLSVAPFVEGDFILDVGTGAGLPGVPLAILFPEKQFVLLDSIGKKIHFLTQVLFELKCNNAKAIQSRAENFSEKKPFDVIICRAVSEAKDIIQYTKHLISPKGKWLLMKGPDYQKELSEIPGPVQVKPLFVPGMEAERNLVIINRSELWQKS